MSTVEYPDSIRFVIFGMGGWCRKKGFVQIASWVIRAWLKKNFLGSWVVVLTNWMVSTKWCVLGKLPT